MRWSTARARAGRVLRELVRSEPTTLASALSFYTLFSLAPLLLVLTSMAGLVFDSEAGTGAARTPSSAPPARWPCS